MRIAKLAFLVSIALASTSATAQVRGTTATEADTPPAIVDTRVAVTADTNAGRVGRRQTRDDAARETGIEPMARINNRIANRVQSRLRNRIDPNYDPRANTASPFAVAGEQLRSNGRRR